MLNFLLQRSVCFSKLSCCWFCIISFLAAAIKHLTCENRVCEPLQKRSSFILGLTNLAWWIISSWNREQRHNQTIHQRLRGPLNKLENHLQWVYTRNESSSDGVRTVYTLLHVSITAEFKTRAHSGCVFFNQLRFLGWGDFFGLKLILDHLFHEGLL